MTACRLGEVEADVVQRIARAPSVFCFLDYDGTLAPVVATPDAASPLSGTAAVLQALAGRPGTQVALVTGRSVADLRRLLDVPGIYYVGIHGLEVCFPNGTVELSESVAAMRSVLPAIKREMEQTLASCPGILIEDKGLALACHYRLTSPGDGASARETVAAIAEIHQRRGAPVMVTHGHEVVEVRSALANKGKTVCQLLAACAPTALAVYIGDDQTDEDAFLSLPPESITIRVGPASVPTAARYRIADPDEVLRFLRLVVAHRHNRAPATAQTVDG